MKGEFYVKRPKAPDENGTWRAAVMYNPGFWHFSRQAGVCEVGADEISPFLPRHKRVIVRAQTRADIANRGIGELSADSIYANYGDLLDKAYEEGLKHIPQDPFVGLFDLADETTRERVEAEREKQRLEKTLMDMEDTNISRSRLADRCGSADFIGRDPETGQTRYAQRGWTNPDPYATQIMPLWMIEKRREKLRRLSA